MHGEVTYHQQISYCGKPRCRKCRDGIGHGPYWYAYRTANGRTTRTYIGKTLPPDVHIPQNVTGLVTPTEPENLALKVYMLGQFRLERRNGREWQSVSDSPWQHRRNRLLLARLLNSPGRKLGREQMMDALWPELDLETATGRLDRAVHSLRQVLEPSLSRLAASHLLRTEREGLILADQSEIWVDADAFEHLLSQAHDARKPLSEQEQLLEEAAALYVGDLLPEERESDWSAPRREVLQRGWLGLLLQLADLRRGRNAFASAIEPLDRLLAADPANEAAVQRLIISLTQVGRRAEAMRAYHRFAAALQDGYNIAPLEETRRLYEAAQQGEIETSLDLDSQSTPQGAAHVEREGRSILAQIGRAHQSPLIGRSAELEAMRQVLATSEQSGRAQAATRKKNALPLDTQRRPQSALLVGEAGIGKTRLAEELSREAQKRGWAIAWSRVYAQESSVPYRQWTEVLRNAESRGLWQWQEISKRSLVYQPLSVLLPELHELLPQIEFPTPLSPEQEQLRLWEATLELLTTVSARTPLLIVLDDLHWADASSCELLGYLIRHLNNRSLMIMGTYRETELPETHPLRSLLTHLQREQVVANIQIQPLTDEQIASLVAPLPGSAVQYIQTQAGGNPFFAEELARGLADDYQQNGSSGLIPAPSTTQPLAAPSPISASLAQALPDTIAAVLNLRMSRLSAPCQRLLGNAAVLGGSFEFPVIVDMEAGTGGAVDEDTVLDLLEEALQAGVLTEEGTGTRIRYHFWHPLLVSHLYDKLSAARRARLHLRAATILQRVYHDREEEEAATITNHLVKAGAANIQIVKYAELAGDRAYALSAYPEAEKYYRIAVEHLEGDAKGVEARVEDEQLKLAYLLERLAECTEIQGMFEETRDLYEKVLNVRSHLNVSQENYQHEAQIKALIWGEIGKTWYDTGDNANARRCFEQGEKVLQDAEVIGGAAWARLRFQQSNISWQEGNYEEARRIAYEALNLFEQALQQPERANKNISYLTGVERTLAGDPANPGRIHALLGAIANSVGEPLDALSHLNIALALFEKYDRQRESAHACCNMGHGYLNKAQYELAQAAFRRSLHLAEGVGDIPLMDVVIGNLGVLAMRSGNLLEAEAKFKQGISLAEQINEQIYISVLHVYLAGALYEQNELAKARKSLHRALIIGRAINNAPCIGFAVVTLGSLYLSQAAAMYWEWRSFGGTIRILSSERTENKSENNLRHLENSLRHLLIHAKTNLQRALALEELEAEIRTEGQLALAQVYLLLGDLHTAWQQAISILNDASQHELPWELACARRLGGCILAAREQQEQAAQYFEQSIVIFHENGMRLEYARTIYNYGVILLQYKDTNRESYQKGLNYLREARQIFSECHAALDLQTVERILATHARENVKK